MRAPRKADWRGEDANELGNLCCRDLDPLQRRLIQAKERLRHKQEIIKSCSRQ